MSSRGKLGAANSPEQPCPLSRLAAGLLASVVFGAALYCAARRSVEDLTYIFRSAPRQIVPEGHDVQVQIVKRHVPQGETLFYFMDKPEAWQFGLWQRSLFPGYVLIPVRESAQIHSEMVRVLEARHHVRYALAAGSPPPNLSFSWKVPLPEYPNGIPTILGRLHE